MGNLGIVDQHHQGLARDVDALDVDADLHARERRTDTATNAAAVRDPQRRIRPLRYEAVRIEFARSVEDYEALLPWNCALATTM